MCRVTHRSYGREIGKSLTHSAAIAPPSLAGLAAATQPTLRLALALRNAHSAHVTRAQRNEFLAVPSEEALSSWRRFAIRLIAVCVLGVLVGAAWLVFRPPVDRQLTSYGEPVANAAQLLDQTEQAMRAEVADRHGSRAPDARCYYATDSATPTAGGPKRPAGRDRRPVLCGPVLFVDGDPSRPYLTFNLVATPTPAGTCGWRVDSPDGEADSPDPRPASQLVRPDGKLPPATDRLAAPRPPAAVGDVLTTTSTLRTQLTAAPPTARMVGQLSGVRLVEYGFVRATAGATGPGPPRPVTGLLAFATVPLAGESGSQPPDLSVRVDGVERGPLTVDLGLPGHRGTRRGPRGGAGAHRQRVKQSISLLTGSPDADNPAVTARMHTAQALSHGQPVRVRLKTVGRHRHARRHPHRCRRCRCPTGPPTAPPAATPTGPGCTSRATVELDGDHRPMAPKRG